MQGGFATQGTVVSRTENEIVVGFPASSAMARESLDRPAARSVVESLLGEFNGRPLVLRLELRDDLPVVALPEPAPRPTPTTPATSRPQSTATIEEQFYADPLIAEALRLFEARITMIKSPAGQPAAGGG
jgi:hypothetical protein